MHSADEISHLLDRCSWPDLSPKHDRALRLAVRFIFERYPVHGIVLSGTILEGTPDASSDLDIYAIHTRPERQRLQRWYNEIPVEIFVNPACAVRRYFEHERNHPATANMLGTGHVIHAQDPIVEQLRHEARQWRQCLPDLSAEQLVPLRYAAADRLDNARDLRIRDPAAAQMILNDAVRQMLEYRFLAANCHLPREKKRLSALAALDDNAAELARRFYTTPDPASRFGLAETLAQHTLGVTGFFEWESNLEAVPDCGE